MPKTVQYGGLLSIHALTSVYTVFLKTSQLQIFFWQKDEICILSDYEFVKKNHKNSENFSKTKKLQQM